MESGQSGVFLGRHSGLEYMLFPFLEHFLATIMNAGASGRYFDRYGAYDEVFRRKRYYGAAGILSLRADHAGFRGKGDGRKERNRLNEVGESRVEISVKT